MSKELNYFDDQTILSTPNPIHSSSMSRDKFQKKISYKYSEKASDMDTSLGIFSVKGDDISIRPTLSNAALLRQQAVEGAKNALEHYSKPVSSLPSRFLRPSEVSTSCNSEHLLHNESTISESDLLPGNSSTPRGSMLCDADFVARSRASFGQAISNLANSVSNPFYDINKIAEEVHKTMDPGSFLESGEDIVAKFERDEMSWQRERDIPAQLKEFSVSGRSDLKLSMGHFFKERSDDLPRLFAKSPEKSQPPIPLLEASDSALNLKDDTVDDESWSLSKIQKIIADPQSPEKALDQFIKPKKKSQKKSLIDLDKTEGKHSEDKYEARKENISPEFHRKKSILSSVQLIEDKNEATEEHLSPEFHPEKSILSLRSSSSLSSLPNGKLPIATTKTEIIWGCIKPGRSNSQEFILRNRSSNRVGIICSVSNPSYRLNKEGSELNFTSMIKIILHPYESRTVSVTFAPTTLGAAVDMLNFTSMDPNHKHSVKQFIKLFGYGGYGKISTDKIIKDTTGKFLLSLGNIDSQQELTQAFIIRNSGSLPAFACFDFILNGLYSFSSIRISPRTAVLLPGEEKEVSVTYNLPKKDFSYIKSKINNCVIDMGKLQMIHGTEIDRNRLRKVSQKAKEKNIEVSSCIYNLTGKIPGEVAPNDLKYFRESSQSVEEILKLLNNEEITITLEQDVDYTLTGQLQDETSMFQSLCENSNLDMLENTTWGESCHVEPSRIILTPPDKVRDKIFLINNNKKTLYFEVNSTPEGLHLNPRNGTINPGDTLIVEITYTQGRNDKTVFKVKILADNECFEVDVKVIFVNRALC